MTQPHLFVDVRDLSRAVSAPHGFERDLADPALWTASARRSRARREAAVRAAGHRSPVLATVAVGVAVAASATVAPSISEAHRTTRATGVTAIQTALGVPADGVMGPATRAAVKAFQRDRGLVADGIVGPLTRAALGLAAGSGDTTRTATGVSAAGSWVADVQRRLGIPADGVYGPQTRQAVTEFQAQKGLAADGVVGPATRAALGLASAPATTKAQAAPAPAASGGSAVSAARAQVGKPYAYAGNGPNAFDCSGLTVYAFRAAGVSLPRTSFAQYGVGSPVSRDAIQAGDLVFFDSNGPGASHVGVATGPTSFVSATSRGVMETSIDSGYWSQHYVGARRVS